MDTLHSALVGFCFGAAVSGYILAAIKRSLGWVVYALAWSLFCGFMFA